MRIFVTGATGFIGSALVPELIEAGHQVVGLARSDASAAALTAAGAEAVLGTIDDLEVLRDTAAASDGVIHLAFKGDVAFSGDYRGAAEADRRAVDAFGDALAGTDRPFVLASGFIGLPSGRVVTETDVPMIDDSPFLIRTATAQAALTFASRGVRSSVVRVSPTVHGEGDYAWVPGLIAAARTKGVSGYTGDGANHWPAVHRLDIARLFRLAVEKAPAASVLHGAAEEGVAIRDIAEVIGRHLDVPVTSVAPEAAAEHFTWLSSFIGLDVLVSNALTRELLDWQPTHPGLLEDLDKGHYFHTNSTVNEADRLIAPLTDR
ncbi:Nucleoside-diphosphate-sugar epimerase [Streptosporangium subroseum]|uniref:Nucleoside-diphosphate-sugar epimerase n=1 Tax=Streptosporangium subroseum TaxID=106412 RepID=A0A239H6U8_9ACTN|nr:SDR family oxidoreductase [Streptosporangium subroseum]SNS77156.1 Nucleoside-diphosphate-sugar epimerase [Streptosporangium subroseum]